MIKGKITSLLVKIRLPGSVQIIPGSLLRVPHFCPFPCIKNLLSQLPVDHTGASAAGGSPWPLMILRTAVHPQKSSLDAPRAPVCGPQPILRFSLETGEWSHSQLYLLYHLPPGPQRSSPCVTLSFSFIFCI